MNQTLRIFLKNGKPCFRVRVQPRASRTGIVGMWSDALKLQVTAAPERSRANKLLVEFLARLLKVAESSVHLVAGQKSRTKTVQIESLNGPELRRRLTPYLVCAI